MAAAESIGDAPPPIASVVTTVFNREHTLARAMRSVLEQSFRDFEYVIVDDGSTDGSATVAESFADPRVRFIRLTHRGRAAALNAAFALCRGEFILIQDSDDVALPERFARQVNFLRSNPDVGMVGCQCRLVDEHGTGSRVLHLPMNHEQILPLMMLTSAVIFGACAVCRKAALEAGGFDESLVAAEDYDFQLRLLSSTRFHNLEDALEEIHVSMDSQGTRYRIEQNHITMRSALAVIDAEKSHLRLFSRARDVWMCEALVHYYYGDTAESRKKLLRLLRRSPLRLTLLRYIIPTLLGSKLLNRLRDRGVTRRLGLPFRSLAGSRKYFLP